MENWRDYPLEAPTRAALEAMLASPAQAPHMLWMGPPGAGKTSMLRGFVREAQPHAFQTLWLTGADQLDAAFFEEHVFAFVERGDAGRRFLVVDEADCLPEAAQRLLARLLAQPDCGAAIWLISNRFAPLEETLRDLLLVVHVPPYGRAYLEALARARAPEASEARRAAWLEHAAGDVRVVLAAAAAGAEPPPAPRALALAWERALRAARGETRARLLAWTARRWPQLRAGAWVDKLTRAWARQLEDGGAAATTVEPAVSDAA